MGKERVKLHYFDFCGLKWKRRGVDRLPFQNCQARPFADTLKKRCKQLHKSEKEKEH